MLRRKGSAGRVTDAERRLARVQDQDRGRLERLGIDAAARIGFKAQAAALAALERGRTPVRAATEQLGAALPVLRAAMVAGHMAGLKRSLIVLDGQKRLALAGKTGYEGAVQALRKRLDMSEEELAALEAKYEAEALRVLKQADARVEKELQETVSGLIEEGATIRDGKVALGEAFERLGLLPDNSFTLEAIFRTQTQMAYGAGRWAADQAPEVQEILWGYKYVTVGDDRVRPEHVGFEGVTLPKEDPFWATNWPPNGWACRCAVISVFEERQPVPCPDEVEVDGVWVRPSADDGFAFNPGLALAI